MSSGDVQELFNLIRELSERVASLETTVGTAVGGPVDVSRLRWDGKALNFVIMKVVAPVLITVLLGGAAFYYGISCQVGELQSTVTQHISGQQHGM